VSITAEQVMGWVGFIPRLAVAICFVAVMGSILFIWSFFMPEAITVIGDLVRDMRKFVVQGKHIPSRRYTE
jgi:hypothetical protein